MGPGEKVCPKCGLGHSEWGNPQGDGNGYCCESCAEGSQCTCTEEFAGEELEPESAQAEEGG